MGENNVDLMLSNISAKQSAEWAFFNRIEPFPEDKIIMTLVHIAMQFATVFMQRKDKKPWTEEDFTPKFGLALFKKEPKENIISSVKRWMGVSIGKKKVYKRIPYSLESKVKPSKRVPKRLREK